MSRWDEVGERARKRAQEAGQRRLRRELRRMLRPSDPRERERAYRRSYNLRLMAAGKRTLGTPQQQARESRVERIKPLVLECLGPGGWKLAQPVADWLATP